MWPATVLGAGNARPAGHCRAGLGLDVPDGEHVGRVGPAGVSESDLVEEVNDVRLALLDDAESLGELLMLFEEGAQTLLLR